MKNIKNNVKKILIVSIPNIAILYLMNKYDPYKNAKQNNKKL